MNLFSNPVMINELRGRMRGRRSMIMLTVYLSITGIVTLLLYLAVTSSMGTLELEAGRIIGKAIFITVITTALIQVCLITPTLTAGSIAGEKERQTYDLLLITTLSPWEIVLGKMMAQLAFAMLMIMAVLPLAGLAFIFGGVSGIELVIAMVGLSVTALLYAAEGLFWSTVMKTTQGATTMAIATIVLLLLVIPFIFIIFGIIFEPLWDLSHSIFHAYGIGTMLCLHPFIALGMTAVFISEGRPSFFFEVSPMHGDAFLVPHPWIAYTLLALIITAILLVVTVRMIKPPEYEHKKSRQ